MAIGRLGSATRCAAITKSDDTIVGCRAVWVGGTGDLVVIPIDDYEPSAPTSNTVTFDNVPDGTLVPVACAKIMAATSSTLMVAMF